MGRSLKTVVAWNDGDTQLHPVGPTSHEEQLLRDTLATARDRYDGAEIVDWGRRDQTVEQIRSYAEAKRRSDTEIDRLMDQYEA